MSSIALATVLIAARPELGEPVRDSRSAEMAATLFPFLQRIRKDRLSEEALRMLDQRRARVARCGQDAPCVVTASIWADDERNRLAAAAAAGGAVPGGEPPDDGTAAQISREVDGLNSVLQVYGLGRKPRNPDLDGPIDRPGEAAFAERVAEAVALGAAAPVGDRSIDPSVDLAVSLLDVNDREDAVAYEPVDQMQNVFVARRIAATNWSRSLFTVIIVPGNGPEVPGETLSPRGKLRVRLAAERFAAGVAPFVMVSGGAVHPRRTSIGEAVEMRKALIERYGVPADRIILEPYARTTSTNLRNAVRRLRALGIPLDREAVILTDAEHSRFVGSPEMVSRNLSELGYRPGVIGRRLSDTELAFLPSRASLRVDPRDPLDP